MIRHAAICVRSHQRPATYLETHRHLLSNVRSLASTAIEAICFPALLDVSCSSRELTAQGLSRRNMADQALVLSNDRGRSVRLRNSTVLPFIDGSETEDKTCYCVVTNHDLIPPRC
jgi:hypothetical protein